MEKRWNKYSRSYISHFFHSRCYHIGCSNLYRSSEWHSTVFSYYIIECSPQCKSNISHYCPTHSYTNFMFRKCSEFFCNCNGYRTNLPMEERRNRYSRSYLSQLFHSKCCHIRCSNLYRDSKWNSTVYTCYLIECRSQCKSGGRHYCATHRHTNFMFR